MSNSFDIVVVGAGVVGSAIARDLSRYEASVCLIEANPDFGDEASKGNSAIMCTGWDTSRNTLERELVIRGYQRYSEEHKSLGLPLKKIGETMVAWQEDDLPVLEIKFKQAREDGFPVKWLDQASLYQQHPGLGDGALAGLHIPDECIVDPFSTVYAYVLDAYANGVTYYPNSPLIAARREHGQWVLNTGTKQVTAKIVINTAGLSGDKIDHLAGYRDFTIKPRKGQFLLFDKLAAQHVSSIIVPTPSAAGRGVLIIPTIFGNVMVGPTAEEVDDANDRSVTDEVMQQLTAGYLRILPALNKYPTVTSFAGMRPATEHSEYQIKHHKEQDWVTVGGIRSTGLSASLGIAEYVSKLFSNDYDLKPKADIKLVTVPDLSSERIFPWQISEKPEDMEIVCHCEQIALGDLQRSINSSVPPKTLKALKRRTRAGYGRCQGFFCGARTQQLFNDAQGVQVCKI